jgi:hypothetical protein
LDEYLQDNPEFNLWPFKKEYSLESSVVGVSLSTMMIHNCDFIQYETEVIDDNNDDYHKNKNDNKNNDDDKKKTTKTKTTSTKGVAMTSTNHTTMVDRV